MQRIVPANLRPAVTHRHPSSLIVPRRALYRLGRMRGNVAGVTLKPSASEHRDWLWHITVCVGVIVIAYGLTEACSAGEGRLRSTGGLLQLCGLVGLAIGIRNLRREAGLPPIPVEIRDEAKISMEEAKTSLEQLFGKPPTPKIVGLGGATIGTGSRAIGDLTVTQSPPPTTEEKVRKLEAQYAALKDQADATDEKVQEESSKREQAIADEAGERQRADLGLSEKVKAFAVGGIRLEIIGLVWLIVGTILSTWAFEITP